MANQFCNTCGSSMDARATLILYIIGGILAAIFSGIIIAALMPLWNDLISQMGGSYY